MSWIDDAYEDLLSSERQWPDAARSFLQKHRLRADQAVAAQVVSERLREILVFAAYAGLHQNDPGTAERYARWAAAMPADGIDDNAKRTVRMARSARVQALFAMKQFARAKEELGSLEAEAPGDPWAVNMRDLIRAVRNRAAARKLLYAGGALVLVSWCMRFTIGRQSPLLPLCGTALLVAALIVDTWNRALERSLRQRGQELVPGRTVVRRV